ncbi:hypothetical protein [Paenibacillus hexagrammi]|uniref:Uncharacterized protein n=1 Tax=Paenibacillus hexagrammi TaxID=2908839 RepID=A0ABY3SRQ5_9BACL|nr:hypothetical protein [Paenibacillus sp. YPD9-1]UJF36629.1 hypothetical protein L0M14_30535 [Paenibacillus sp. YPD9-1]
MRVDITVLGEGQFVEIRNPKLLPWGIQRDLTNSLKDNSTESQMAFAEKLAVVLIRSGHVLDENGTPVQFPLTHETVSYVPSPVVEAVAVAFAEARKGSADLPNA